LAIYKISKNYITKKYNVKRYYSILRIYGDKKIKSTIFLATPKKQLKIPCDMPNDNKLNVYYCCVEIGN